MERQAIHRKFFLEDVVADDELVGHFTYSFAASIESDPDLEKIMESDTVVQPLQRLVREKTQLRRNDMQLITVEAHTHRLRP